MSFRVLAVCLFILQVASTQFYGIPAPTAYPYYNNYYYPTTISNYYYPPPTPAPPIFAPAFAPTYPNIPTKPPTSPPKRSVATPHDLNKCSPPTAIAYFLPTPTEKVKASVISTDDLVSPKYTCPVCNGFADILPNPKVPPPPVGSSVLPGILDKISTIAEDLKIKNPLSVLSPKIKKPLVSDMHEKFKLPKNLSYDQELLEGFLIGLGL